MLGRSALVRDDVASGRLLRLSESIGDRFDGLQGPPDALDRFVRLQR